MRCIRSIRTPQDIDDAWQEIHDFCFYFKYRKDLETVYNKFEQLMSYKELSIEHFGSYSTL